MQNEDEVQGVERDEREMKFDLINHPHPHSLIFYRDGKPDGQDVCCSGCQQPWRPPAFGCSESECNFHLHQSCLDLPPQIRTDFHPQHRLSLTKNNNLCNCCYQMPTGDTYDCYNCGFQIDVQCAIAHTKASGLQRTPGGEFRHFSHPHPLTFQQEQEQVRGNIKVVCVVCQLLITAGSTNYFCSNCDYHFHQQCAELPREISKIDYHEHPLFLFPRPFVHNTLCDSCRNECVEFFYGCPLPFCRFNLHVACLSSFKHEHAFVNLRKELSYNCHVCGKQEYGFPWFCSICHVFAHKKCAELPLILQTSEHDDPLTLTFSLDRLDVTINICKICGEEINTSCAGYVCSQCKYIAHLDCAENLQIEKSEDEEQDIESTLTEAVDPSVNANNDIHLEEDTQNEENGILHFSHKHNLTLCPGEDKRCDGCMRCISTQSYACLQCGFFLHEECARLPRYKNSLLHQHLLSIVYIPDFVFSCAACLQYCHGFAYHCEECCFNIDIQCAAIRIPFTHYCHDHPLSLYRVNDNQKCEACLEEMKNKVAFRCVDCNFYLDARCATLPLAVRYRFDEHPLILTRVNEDEEEDEYYCDICEEGREADQWFYYCRQCCFAAHTGCALGEYPFLKSAKCESHLHPLDLVKEGKEGYSACGGCGDSCDGNLAIECRRCKFNVHAFGPCYHRQLMQGRITFTMPSSYSRSLALDVQPIQLHGSKPISLGRYGGRGGYPWNETVFSTIRRFVVRHGGWIDSIQIEYEKNGKSFWSEMHGGDGGTRFEVVLDYPDEYLVTIHGHYDDILWDGNMILVVQSLSFISNRKSYGPFGTEEGTEFSFATDGMKIVGMYGRSGQYLDSIGLYAVPIQYQH